MSRNRIHATEREKALKVGSLQTGGPSGFRRYRDLYYGNVSLGRVLWTECVVALVGSWPGGLGILLRSRLLTPLFARAGRGVRIGRNVTVRHWSKIRLGNNVIIDDHCVLDAKGADNKGITLDDNVFLGRNTIVYCKNGNIHLERNVNVSANCTLFSSNRLAVGAGTVVGAYSYLLSGGVYDYSGEAEPFAEQTGMKSRGPLLIGRNCWIGARVTVLDGAGVGEHCVIGAGAVVVRPVPAHSLAVGVPASVKKTGILGKVCRSSTDDGGA